MTVIVRTHSYFGAIFGVAPLEEVRHYRWRWMARLVAWTINNIPPPGMGLGYQTAEVME